MQVFLFLTFFLFIFVLILLITNKLLLFNKNIFNKNIKIIILIYMKELALQFLA